MNVFCLNSIKRFLFFVVRYINVKLYKMSINVFTLLILYKNDIVYDSIIVQQS